MKLNKDEPFIQRVNDEQNIRYIQNDVAFNGAGTPLGKMVEGKLQPFKGGDNQVSGKGSVNPDVDSGEAESTPDDLDSMDLPTLKEYAKANDVAFAGNIGADSLRNKIRDALSA